MDCRSLQELPASLGIPCPQVLRNEDGTKASLATKKMPMCLVEEYRPENWIVQGSNT